MGGSILNKLIKPCLATGICCYTHTHTLIVCVFTCDTKEDQVVLECKMVSR